MKRVRIAELEDHLYEHLRAVEHGAEIEVTDRGRPIARLVPVEAGSHIRPATRSFRAMLRRPRTPVRRSISSLELLLGDRGER